VTTALFWLSVVVAVIAELAIVAATVRASRPHEVSDVPAIAEGETGTLPSPRRGLEVLWAVIPALALAALFVLTWRAMNPSAEDGASSTTAAVAGSGIIR
jgi:heme/copper-type cytochrome/quinol oxidase subunit 2